MKHEHGLQSTHGQTAAETQTNGVQMKTKGRRQSKNVEENSPYQHKRLSASILDATNWPDTDNDDKTRVGLSKRQVRDQSAVSRGRKMGMDPIHKAIESGKFGANSAMPHKTGRNPFAKARSK